MPYGYNYKEWDKLSPSERAAIILKRHKEKEAARKKEIEKSKGKMIFQSKINEDKQ